MGFIKLLEKEFYNRSKTKKLKVVGFVNEFNFQSLHHKVQPLVFYYLGENYYSRNIVIKGDIANCEKLLTEINKAWKIVVGNEYMSHYFMEDRIAVLYEKEANAKTVNRSFPFGCHPDFLFRIIALLTVSYQSYRAAARNPVEALRYE